MITKNLYCYFTRAFLIFETLDAHKILFMEIPSNIFIIILIPTYEQLSIRFLTSNKHFFYKVELQNN